MYYHQRPDPVAGFFVAAGPARDELLELLAEKFDRAADELLADDAVRNAALAELAEQFDRAADELLAEQSASAADVRRIGLDRITGDCLQRP